MTRADPYNSELNADVIMRRFIEDEIVFELPAGVPGEQGVVATRS